MAEVGRVLALDPGSKRVGVAVSDSARSMAFPRPALRAGDALVAEVVSLVEDEAASLVVVGLPRSLSGAEGPAAVLARALVEQLRGPLGHRGIDVELHDERLTTVEASRALTAAGHTSRTLKGSVDSAAATVLLESWLAGR
jgi:putative Holliday junction resolvase